jgi:microcystin-dependent protein
MSNPYVGEIRLFGGNFAPLGWALCDGSVLPISENETLFNLIGTIYGGDGQSTFALPDLRGRVPIHIGHGHVQGELSGAETVTLSTAQLPPHTHALMASSATATAAAGPAGNVPAAASNVQFYGPSAPDRAMSAAALSPAGASRPHDNMAPFLGITFIISLFGIFPSQS